MVIAVVVNHLNHSKELYIHTLCETLQCSLNSDFFDAYLLDTSLPSKWISEFRYASTLAIVKRTRVGYPYKIFIKSPINNTLVLLIRAFNKT